MSRDNEIEVQKYELRRIREMTGMNRTRFCEVYGIPLRSMEQWEAGQRKMPDYVLRLLKYNVLVGKIMNRRKYFDASVEEQTVSVIVDGVAVSPAGTTVYAMPVSDRNSEYVRIEEKYGLHFIFEDNIPKLDFYAVPLFDVMAVDDHGGFLGMVGGRCNLDDDRPIIYVSERMEAFELTFTAREFLTNISEWNVGMKPSNALAIFSCKEDAEQVFDFNRIGDEIVG